MSEVVLARVLGLLLSWADRLSVRGSLETLRAH